MEVEAAVIVSFTALGVNYCCGDNVWVIWVNTTDGYGFAIIINISIAIASICAWQNFDNITVIGIVNSRLNS